MTVTYENYYFSRANFHLESEGLTPHPKDWRRLCFCDAPENPDLQYVMCGKCDKWFHVECVAGYTPDETFYCNRCNQEYVSEESF